MTALAEGTAVLTFKDEDEVDGIPVGPVYLATIANGYPVVEARPFDPNRRSGHGGRRRWLTLAEARAMAAARGLPLIEV